MAEGPVTRLANGALVVVAVVALFAGDAPVYASGAQTVTTLVPIPATRRSEVAAVLHALLERQPGAASARSELTGATSSPT